MKQPEDHRTVDWVGGETGKGGAMPDPVVKRRGAYRGAVKIGCANHADRAATGKSQAEFAALAGVSERTLRSWESGQLVSQASTTKIVAALDQLLAIKRQPRRPVRYYDQYTGNSWSGRGLMPKWLRVRLDGGARLADFERDR